MNIDLSGQVAIVTGAGRGIGKEIASVFARCGATVVLAARSADQLAEAASEIVGQGGAAVTTVTDVAGFFFFLGLAALALHWWGM